MDNLIKNIRFSKFIVVLSILTLLAYTIAVLVFYWHGKQVPDSLKYSFFGAFAVELSALAWRTKTESKKQTKEENKFY